MTDLIERAELINKNMVQAKEIERLYAEIDELLARPLFRENKRLTAELKQANVVVEAAHGVLRAESGSREEVAAFKELKQALAAKDAPKQTPKYGGIYGK